MATSLAVRLVGAGSVAGAVVGGAVGPLVLLDFERSARLFYGCFFGVAFGAVVGVLATLIGLLALRVASSFGASPRRRPRVFIGVSSLAAVVLGWLALPPADGQFPMGWALLILIGGTALAGLVARRMLEVGQSR